MNTKKILYLYSSIVLLVCLSFTPISVVAVDLDKSTTTSALQPSTEESGIKYPLNILITVSKNTVYSDGLDFANLEVKTTDSLGAGVSGIVIKFGDSNGKNVIIPPESITGSDGIAHFKISSKQEHVSTFKLSLKNPKTGEFYSSNDVNISFLNQSGLGKAINNISDFRASPITQKAASYVITPVVTVGVVAGFSSSVINFINSFFPYLNYLINLLFQFLGIKRKQKPWGIVYDSMFKKPVELAIVRTFDAKSKALVQTSVTDKMGRFSFDLSNGRYHLEVKKPFYIFPSKLIQGANIDGVYHDLYFGNPFNFKKGEHLNFSIPIDLSTAIEARIGVWDRIRSLSKKISLPVLLISLLLSIFILWVNTTVFNEVLVMLYVLLIIARKSIKKETFQPWGTIFDSESQEIIRDVPIKVFDRKYNKLLETRISDESGEFNFILPKGEYYLRIVSPNYLIAKDSKQFNENPNYRGEKFKVEDNEVLRFNIPLRKK